MKPSNTPVDLAQKSELKVSTARLPTRSIHGRSRWVLARNCFFHVLFVPSIHSVLKPISHGIPYYDRLWSIFRSSRQLALLTFHFAYTWSAPLCGKLMIYRAHLCLETNDIVIILLTVLSDCLCACMYDQMRGASYSTIPITVVVVAVVVPVVVKLATAALASRFCDIHCK